MVLTMGVYRGPSFWKPHADGKTGHWFEGLVLSCRGGAKP